MELVQIYLQYLKKLAIITNFLAFFLFLFENFSLLDPDAQPCRGDPGDNRDKGKVRNKIDQKAIGGLRNRFT